MSRWIDFDFVKSKKRFDKGRMKFIVWMQDIYHAPSIDLVRCAECRYYRDYDGCFFSTAEVEPDGYCYWGERKENE